MTFNPGLAIGSLVSDDNEGNIIVTIPAGTVTGTGYRIRVVSSSPAVKGTPNDNDLTINLPAISIGPSLTQNINAGLNGTTLTVTESPVANSRQWLYGTVSGGPYTTNTGISGTSYAPNFTIQGTFYVVCRSTFDCETLTSNQVQVNVTATVTQAELLVRFVPGHILMYLLQVLVRLTAIPILHNYPMHQVILKSR